MPAGDLKSGAKGQSEGSNECFYIGKDGNKQDAKIHEEILAGGKTDLTWSRNFARKHGFSEDQIKRLFPED